MENIQKNQIDSTASEETGSSPITVPLRIFGNIIEYDGRLDLESLSKQIPKEAYIFNGGDNHIVIAVR